MLRQDQEGNIQRGIQADRKQTASIVVWSTLERRAVGLDFFIKMTRPFQVVARRQTIICFLLYFKREVLASC